ncbi:MAG: hypothetical protein ACRCSF_04960 [Mycobacteriaceae bacterium]
MSEGDLQFDPDVVQSEAKKIISCGDDLWNLISSQGEPNLGISTFGLVGQIFTGAVRTDISLVKAGMLAAGRAVSEIGELVLENARVLTQTEDSVRESFQRIGDALGGNPHG